MTNQKISPMATFAIWCGMSRIPLRGNNWTRPAGQPLSRYAEWLNAYPRTRTFPRSEQEAAGGGWVMRVAAAGAAGWGWGFDKSIPDFLVTRAVLRNVAESILRE